MLEFKVQRGMLIRALKDQLPAEQGKVYGVIDSSFYLTLYSDATGSFRVMTDHSNWQEAHIPYIDPREVVNNVIELKPKSLYGKILQFIKRGT